MLAWARIWALGVAALGVSVFSLLAALMALHMQNVGRLGIGMPAMLGVAVGASITLELLG